MPLEAQHRIVFACNDSPNIHSPSGGLASALEAYGFSSMFADNAAIRSTRSWLKTAAAAPAIIVVAYDGPHEVVTRQLSLASAVHGTPIIRWWVGTDVLHCLQYPQMQASARKLNTFVTENLAVAPHLASELATIGIKAQVIPSLINEKIDEITLPAGAPPKGVLVYLPTKRRAFYGEAVVRQVIKTNPDLRFIIVADDDHLLAQYLNVASVGWVDMETLWDQVGCLLRITEHDGLPRMVLDALARGRYAIYAWPLEGCWLARTVSEVNECLERFRQVSQPNLAGRAAVESLLTVKPSQRYAISIRSVVRKTSLARRIRAAVVGGELTLKWKVASLVHNKR